MAPVIHCVRHAQGYHNLNVASHSIHDPLLTPVGEEQCQELARKFPYHDRVELVVASPLKRTIYTALLAFGEDLARTGGKIIAMPELQETSDLPCDTGSEIKELEREFAGKPVDFSLVVDGWNSKRMKWAPNAAAIERRARDARQWLMNRPEKEIVLVTHGGFLHYFTGDWNGCEKFAGTGWANTEYRSYTFSTYEPADANLVETAESKCRRGKDDKPLDKNEQAQLKETATRDWVKNGYVSKQEATNSSSVKVQA